MASLPCLTRNSAAIIPLSLSISCSVLPPCHHPLTILHEGGHRETFLRVSGNFQSVLHTIRPRSSASHFVTADVFSRMVSIAKTFVNLEGLSLTNHIISDKFYDILGCFPYLYSLTILSCHFETDNSISPGSFIAPGCLQRLILRNITYVHKPDFTVLVSAPSFSSLCFDRTSGNCLPTSGGTYQKLTFLQVYDTPGWAQPWMMSDDVATVALAIASCSPFIETLVFNIPLLFPPTLDIAPMDLPRSLKTYCGPASLLLKITSHIEFQRILVVEIFDKHINLDTAFSSVARSMPALQRLTVTLETWDRSFPDALFHLKDLRNLRYICINVGKLVLVRNLFIPVHANLIGVLGGPGELLASPFVGSYPTHQVEILPFTPKIKTPLVSSPNTTGFYNTFGCGCYGIVLAVLWYMAQGE